MHVQDTTPFKAPSSLSYSPYAEALIESVRREKRSDSSIRDEIYESLCSHTQIAADDIQVSVNDGDVLLEGTVPEREMKTLAEDVVEKCFGIREVMNHLEECHS